MRQILYSNRRTKKRGNFMSLIIITIVLQIAGTLAILAELVSGFGLLAIAAVGFFVSSYYIVFNDSPQMIIPLIVINLISIPLTIVLGVKKTLQKSKMLLNDNIDGVGFVSPVNIGETGVAITDLRPAGTAKINEKHIDVYSEGEYIPKGTKIQVISAENAGVKVTAVLQTNSDESNS
jgi:membrane-bound serine protease (ClpP class)